MPGSIELVGESGWVENWGDVSFNPNSIVMGSNLDDYDPNATYNEDIGIPRGSSDRWGDFTIDFTVELEHTNSIFYLELYDLTSAVGGTIRASGAQAISGASALELETNTVNPADTGSLSIPVGSPVTCTLRYTAADNLSEFEVSNGSSSTTLSHTQQLSGASPVKLYILAVDADASFTVMTLATITSIFVEWEDVAGLPGTLNSDCGQVSDPSYDPGMTANIYIEANGNTVNPNPLNYACTGPDDPCAEACNESTSISPMDEDAWDVIGGPWQFPGDEISIVSESGEGYNPYIRYYREIASGAGGWPEDFEISFTAEFSGEDDRFDVYLHNHSDGSSGDDYLWASVSVNGPFYSLIPAKRWGIFIEVNSTTEDEVESPSNADYAGGEIDLTFTWENAAQDWSIRYVKGAADESDTVSTGSGSSGPWYLFIGHLWGGVTITNVSITGTFE